ncbi:uroporphyrinogen-III synthase [Undibacterium arcticum]|uniref:Uroporphyrinogen-III synthase n=1 Tax=Undibacterium arcticum TaxID=1762892 RepID=A0ABV7F1C4_9BURK
MLDKTIALLENRLGDQMADLVKKYGGTPFSAPALAEIPDIDPAHITELLKEWDLKPPDIFIFQTGVGVKALFAATDSLNLTDQLLGRLEAAQVVVRGPKPTAVLRSRNVRIDFSAKEPYTTDEVLFELDSVMLHGKRVVVQRYGETNWELQTALEGKGAQVVEIATYRWSLPENIEPLIKLMDALDRNEIDAVAFTSASQANNLFSVAQQAGRQETLKNSLNRTVIASIGPVCTAALNKLGIRVNIEPHPPKLGPFITAINGMLSES